MRLELLIPSQILHLLTKFENTTTNIRYNITHFHITSNKMKEEDSNEELLIQKHILLIIELPNYYCDILLDFL